MSQHTQVIEVKSNLDDMRKKLFAKWDFQSINNPQAKFQLKCDNGVIVAYSSGKIVVQSSDNLWIDKVCVFLAGFEDSAVCHKKISTEASLRVNEADKLQIRKNLNSIDNGFVPYAGVDESGKGDFFGPLVVGAVFIEKEEITKKLMSLGVRDSKQLSDRKILELDSAIRSLTKCETLVIKPYDYNHLYSHIKNVNKLLAWGHANTLEQLLSKQIVRKKCQKIVFDKFANSDDRILDALKADLRSKEIVQMHRGEADIAVAAASIIARAKFVIEMNELSKRYGVSFPKGATHVIDFGRKFIEKFGLEELQSVSKVSFSTYSKVIELRIL
ncbi:ribonuclease HIII [Candidatus Dojkabacteria bacterium]|nr:ribonuclease HIII [Candidatus Dojkabacteria bacterium]